MGDTGVEKLTVRRGSSITMPDPIFYMPGVTFKGWTTDSQAGTWKIGDSFTVTKDMVFNASLKEDGSNAITGKHDFSGFKSDVSLKNKTFISNTVSRPLK